MNGVQFSDVVGRYVTLRIGGDKFKVFFSEVGQGTPLVCQHGGGLHNHQWRHVLEDSELAETYRIVALDLPMHGKSDPSSSRRWWEEPYKLGRDFFLEFVLRMCDALELDQPIFMGQGSSGNLALQLALHYPDRFGGVIPLEAAERTAGSNMEWFESPLIGSELAAGFVWDQMAPMSPDADRWATWFYYTQGGWAFNGDLNFFSVEHDLRGLLDRIDTAQCPVVMMTAEYDYVTPPSMSAATASQIPNAHFIEMPGLGHFVASENYPVFRPHLMEALALIAGRVPAVHVTPAVH